MFVSKLRTAPFVTALLLCACSAQSSDPAPDNGSADVAAPAPSPDRDAGSGSTQPAPDPVPAATNPVPPPNPSAPANELPPVNPAPPGTPGGLDDDRTPVSEAPSSNASPQGAANVVQTYYALIEAHEYADARKLWFDGGVSSGMDSKAFADAFGKYRDYHAEIGAPGAPQGAAGSVYVEVPIQAYGRRADGKPFKERGKVTLRRINDVPGSTAAQRQWHISGITVGPGSSGS